MELLSKLEKKEHFTERECEIADYILRNCEAVLKMTTRELAVETFTSATVIVRFVKKIGYEGIQDFKLHLLIDLKESQFERVEVEHKEHILSLMNKISSLHEKSLFETKEMLSTETLEKIQAAFQKYDIINFSASMPIVPSGSTPHTILFKQAAVQMSMRQLTRSCYMNIM